MRKSITLLLLLLGFGMGASAVKGQVWSIALTEVMYRSPAVPDSLEFIEIVTLELFQEFESVFFYCWSCVFNFRT
ncbi:MAG: hypothetical protein IPN95_12625 [Bacteroidetes bacterium]|nr:hypothetical protein [Bacteroidota bacterium]